MVQPERAAPAPTLAGALRGALPADEQLAAQASGAYEVVARWEYRLAGQVRRSMVTRHLTVSCDALGAGQRVTVLATPPQLREPDPTPLEELTLLLAGLYRRLVVQVAGEGRPLALLNHSEIQQTWARIEQEAAARFGDGPDCLTTALLAAVARQVQDPAAFLASLQYDYAYGFLLEGFRSPAPLSGRSWAFAHFFADTTIRFQVARTDLPAPAPGCLSYCLHGTLDEQRTDQAAAARQVAAELAPEADASPPPVAPDSLTFVYQATYVVAAATGRPVRVAATVSCRGPAGYAKEYDLTIEEL